MAWIDATGTMQQFVADGPHRIEQTASSPVQQSVVFAGSNAGTPVVLGARPRPSEDQTESPKFESKLA
jgi:hypothetical protein